MSSRLYLGMICCCRRSVVMFDHTMPCRGLWYQEQVEPSTGCGWQITAGGLRSAVRVTVLFPISVKTAEHRRLKSIEFYM
jgi:hypothetical protein